MFASLKIEKACLLIDNRSLNTLEYFNLFLRRNLMRNTPLLSRLKIKQTAFFYTLFFSCLVLLPEAADAQKTSWGDRRTRISIDSDQFVNSEIGKIKIQAGDIELTWAIDEVVRTRDHSELLSKSYLRSGILAEDAHFNFLAIPKGTRLLFFDPLRSEIGPPLMLSTSSIIEVGGIQFKSVNIVGFEITEGTGNGKPVVLKIDKNSKIKIRGSLAQELTIQGWKLESSYKAGTGRISFSTTLESLENTRYEAFKLEEWSLAVDQEHVIGNSTVKFFAGDHLQKRYENAQDQRPGPFGTSLHVESKNEVMVMEKYIAHPFRGYSLETGNLIYFNLAKPAVFNGITAAADCKYENTYYKDYVTLYPDGEIRSVCPEVLGKIKVNGYKIDTVYGNYPVHFWRNGEVKMMAIHRNEKFELKTENGILTHLGGTPVEAYYNTRGEIKLVLFRAVDRKPSTYYEINNGVGSPVSNNFINRVIAETSAQSGPSTQLEQWLSL